VASVLSALLAASLATRARSIVLAMRSIRGDVSRRPGSRTMRRVRHTLRADPRPRIKT